MKKYIIASIIALVAIVTSVNVYQTNNEFNLSDLTLANVDALANNEDNDKDEKSCFKSVTEAPKGQSLAISARKCSDCDMYWATAASDRSTCRP